MEGGFYAILYTGILPVLWVIQSDLATGKEGVRGGGCDWVAIVVFKEVADAFHPKEERWPPILALWRSWDAMGNALGDWKSHSGRNWEQKR